jgi:hypothetical protein
MKSDGMKKWHVFTVLKTLPLILLLSLLLFFAGIIELLVEVDRTTAVVVSVVVGIAIAFIVATTVVPTFLTFCIRWRGHHQFTQCPWKSGQAWVFYQLVGAPLHLIASAIATFRGQPLPDDEKDILGLRDWSVYDWLVYKDSDVADVGFGVHWLGKMYLGEKKLAEALYQCILDTSTHESLQKLIVKQDIRRAVSIDRASNWMPPPTTDINLDVVQTRAAHSDWTYSARSMKETLIKISIARWSAI